MNKIYLCIDLKTFYASVECIERNLDPYKTDLVVADTKRSKGAICLAISPKMKERGIKNRCRIWEIPPNINPIIAKPRMKKYIQYSAQIYSIYLKYISKEDIYPYSIDEMFLDITNYQKLYNKNPIEIAKMIMKDIYLSTGITSSCGIGTNLYLTKIALDIIAKHSKNHIGYLNEETYKLLLWHHLPITDFWNISYGTENRLHKLHIKDMYDIAHCNESILYKEFGINAKLLIDHAWGIETCTIKEIKAYQPKSSSISNSQILYKDYNYQNARIILIEMLDNLTLELIEKQLVTNHININIGYSKDIKPPLKISIKLPEDTDNYKNILTNSLKEYDYQINETTPIRRISISYTNTHKKKYHQISLFSSFEEENNYHHLQQTILQIKHKYGKNSILKAISYSKEATQIERNKLIGGHNAE